MTEPRRFGGTTRRDFLRLTGALAAASAGAGCGFFSTEPTAPQGAAGAAKGLEAPSLAARVQAGELPPVAERLPRTPMVVTPASTMGVYGGTWRTALTGPGDGFWLLKTVGYEPLLRWDPVGNTVVPNVAESFEVSADGRTVTLRLRPGMRWSDGAPFTADDIAFSYNDVLQDPELGGGAPGWLRAGGKSDGEPARLEVVDPHTVRLVFAEPSGLVLLYLANTEETYDLLRPAHYLTQFHPRHGGDLTALVAQAQASNPVDLFHRKASEGIGDVAHWQNTDLPRLTAWMPSAPFGQGNEFVVERNPYYWKTDPEGSQLPYVDAIRYAIVQDNQAVLQMALNGELDLHQRHINDAVNKPVVVDNEARGGYKVYSTVDTIANSATIFFNMGHANPTLRSVFRSKDFRVGLSVAIDRAEISKVVYAGQADPWQVAPLKDSGYYHERLATQHTAFDVAQANAHLDRAGLANRDAQGRRLGPDGQPVSFVLSYPLGIQSAFANVAELVRGQWANVGVTAVVKGLERSFFNSQLGAKEHEAYIFVGQGGGPEAIVDPISYVPFSPPPDSSAGYAPTWAEWYDSGGTAGEEPPEPTKRQFALFDEIRGTVDGARQKELMAQLLDIAADEFYVIGTVLVRPGAFWGVVSDKMHNLRDAEQTVLASAFFPSPGITFPEQLYLTS
ncbi:ABC transporter substrate-binding protein [Pseudonocardia kunmingensis]|uniref:Peptide/nickel transport system substrate-binding protein n=1 Tax=Pseudonocardia kunmingensis TaxID=630975 RepID=A0A543DNL2_9PSEU|nr:ABC transporter substrate-binding protein [Pseudonocardia kunmingensis]TQM10898.1 peptide/nickel transport system substrate-binding protein [Pseudonocardia kunmingensis]